MSTGFQYDTKIEDEDMYPKVMTILAKLEEVQNLAKGLVHELNPTDNRFYEDIESGDYVTYLTFFKAMVGVEQNALVSHAELNGLVQRLMVPRDDLLEEDPGAPSEDLLGAIKAGHSDGSDLIGIEIDPAVIAEEKRLYERLKKTLTTTTSSCAHVTNGRHSLDANGVCIWCDRIPVKPIVADMTVATLKRTIDDVLETIDEVDSGSVAAGLRHLSYDLYTDNCEEDAVQVSNALLAYREGLRMALELIERENQ